jgi:arginine-tRNA-protein transferase
MPTVKPDSLLTTAKSVTFNPSGQPSITDDEDNAEFRAPAGKKGKRKAIEDGPGAGITEGRKEKGTGEEMGKGGGSNKAKVKAKGKGKAMPMSLSEMVHEGEWEKRDPEKPFKHRFEVSVRDLLSANDDADAGSRNSTYSRSPASRRRSTTSFDAIR